ncbi:hypothetical protein OK006_10759 [Actinobacteria bacterium OK006]|nr:hypothetical protein OK006_10759 [Actinobacteria bacterium OK006]
MPATDATRLRSLQRFEAPPTPAGLRRLTDDPLEHCPRRKPALETQACCHHNSGPPPYHSMIGESATSISSKPTQPARRLISAKPRRLQAAPTGCPSTRTWRPSPLVGGQTITERSVIRQASPASGRSPRCPTRRRAVPGGVLVQTRTKVALDTFAEAAEGRRGLINAVQGERHVGQAGRASLHRPPGERQRPAGTRPSTPITHGPPNGNQRPLSERAPCAARASMHRPTRSAVPVRVLRPRLAPGRTAGPR